MTNQKNIVQINAALQVTALSNYTLQEYEVNGKKYISVPVVMMAEGVREGSAGAILHLAENMAKNINDWNGTPVTVYHPMKDDVYVSAKSRGIQHIGIIENAHLEGNKLKATIRIDEQAMIACSTQAHTALLSGESMDVSIGAFGEVSNEEGEYDGKAYTGVNLSYKPDHLALLPGQEGACNWLDGCGIRANSKSKNKKEQFMTEKQITEAKDLAFNALASLQVNNKGYILRLENIRNMVDSWDNDMSWNMLEEVYDDSFIYRRNSRNGQPSTLYKQKYGIGADNAIELEGEPVLVQKNVTYTEISNNQKPKNKETKTMTRKITECQVNDLIAHNLTNLTEEDRPWLTELSADKAEKLIPKTPQVNKVEKEKSEHTPESVTAYIAKLEKEEDVTALLPEAMQANIKKSLEMQANHRNTLIQGILKGSQEWKEDELKEMQTNMLEKLGKTLKVEPEHIDFSGMSGGQPPAVNSDPDAPEPMMPTETY